METMIHTEVNIPIKEISLNGNLIVPSNAIGIVLFSHGSGSSRFSPRNNFVAEQLHERNIGTLLFDLLTKYEDAIYQNRFNIELLTERLVAVTNWVKDQPDLENFPLGYFGASTGAASALIAASEFGNEISAVISRGGRPDLALHTLNKVEAATLLMAGSLDEHVIGLNQMAYTELTSVKEMKIIDGASHLFEEPGKLEEVASVAADWFEKYLK